MTGKSEVIPGPNSASGKLERIHDRKRVPPVFRTEPQFETVLCKNDTTDSVLRPSGLESSPIPQYSFLALAFSRPSFPITQSARNSCTLCATKGGRGIGTTICGVL